VAVGQFNVVVGGLAIQGDRGLHRRLVSLLVLGLLLRRVLVLLGVALGHHEFSPVRGWGAACFEIRIANRLPGAGRHQYALSSILELWPVDRLENQGLASSAASRFVRAVEEPRDSVQGATSGGNVAPRKRGSPAGPSPLVRAKVASTSPCGCRRICTEGSSVKPSTGAARKPRPSDAHCRSGSTSTVLA
jgi:hypothetical protein